ncbi:basic amino acid/polyamine antiporter [Aeromonas schubertii]|uniref:Basic amino acid/polyamine antiporter n=1 Tax=Aeromonas schubertii TaxID=652 RepID=A0ABS7V6D0_9GAMM|nr:basic amino acid/polyamine antiporter [Aeromonas schubertii]KUE81525.1 arginine-ornithine antiporter [Aeromonas schubertii]MBZ6064924.1 basic amino acid/polyamine antiporter [Aeromonas schubertii]MBZ6071817.1 basic amino acid/polyamine antiporter [Aeromonas schubertii]QCG48494.1 amino acid permease [Aeromonas schubertii]
MDNKLGLGALVSLVIGSMVGAGVFSLPQNIASHAGVGAIAIGWLVTGLGMICLALVYQSLSMRRPDLDGGIFSYAKAGFGDFIGFNAAWGYWICQLLANVSYAVVVFSALSYFFDTPERVIFGDGNTPVAIVLASLLIWSVNALVLKGVKMAAMVNVVTTIAKMVPLIVFCVAILLAFHMETFTLDIWGQQTPELGSVLEQVKSTMKVTLWVFIGIEGAVVVSARARHRRDVGRATVLALLGALALYVMVTLFTLGVMSQPEVAALKNPSTALILEKVVGPWGAWLINIGLVISVMGALLSWTVLAAEVPYIAGKTGVFPEWFSRENKNGSPQVSLWCSAALVQFFLIVIYFQSSTYLALVNIATAAALVPYVFSGAYGLKLALSGQTYEGQPHQRKRDMLLALIATGYGCWLVYAAGIEYLLLVALLYSPGIFIYWKARQHHGLRGMNRLEQGMTAALLGFAVLAFYKVMDGTIPLN